MSVGIFKYSWGREILLVDNCCLTCKCSNATVLSGNVTRKLISVLFSVFLLFFDWNLAIPWLSHMEAASSPWSYLLQGQEVE
jgi:hypothetical protein